jgi:signal transduction histidine kinase
MMARTIVICCCLFMSVASHSQNSIIDSLRAELDDPNDNEKRADILHELSAQSFDYDFDTSHEYALQSLNYAEKSNHTKGVVQALTDIGLYYYFTGDYKGARRYYIQAIERCGSNNFGNYPAYTLTRLGNLHRVQAAFDSARYYYEASLHALKDKKGDIALSSVHYNLGILALDQADYEMALSNLRIALAIQSKKGDSLIIGECWKSIGQVYQGKSMYDSAVYYYEKSFGIANRYNDPELQMFYYVNRGEIYFAGGDYQNATKNFLQALDLLKTHDFKRYHAIVLARIAQVYDAQGDFKQAIDHLLRALRIHESLNNRQEIARVYGTIGWVYVNQKNDSMAVSYAQRSLRLMEQIKDKAGMAFAHNLLGYIHYSRSNYLAALKEYEIALQLRNEIRSDRGTAATTFNIARVYEKQGLYDMAQANLLKVLASDQKYMDKDGLVMTYNTLGNVLTKKKKFLEAERYLQKGHELATAVNTRIELSNNQKAFAELYKAMGEDRKAIRYYDEYIALNDSIFTSQNTAKIAEMNALYELEKKEQEIQSLNQREEINKNKLQLQEAQIRYQNYFLFFTVGSIVLLLITVYMLYQYYRTKAKANEKLSALNREISEQKEEIQAQREELIEANNALVALNHELIEKTEEIQAQSEELKETNAMITEINRDLDSIVTKRTSQLQEAYKELDTFFYRSSHDFRRPLTTFMGLAEVAKITLKDKSALELFSKVRDTAMSLDKMLVKLQSISDVGAQQFVYKEVLIKEIFDTVCDGFSEELEQFGILTESNIKLDKPFVSYPAMVKIIIENLLENAIHFRAMEAPYINLNAYRHGEEVIIEIEDNGQGIRDEYKDRIFDMYFRANDRSKGNGLGLYIVKKAVEKLNGTIQLRTHFGKGSRFVVALPM